MSKSLSLAEIIRGISPGKNKVISGHNANVIRVTAARILGAGNYSVKVSPDVYSYVVCNITKGE